VKRAGTNGASTELKSISGVWDEWEKSSRTFWLEMDALLEALDGFVEREVADG
jgi:hypothetical protein